jgi:hypothetical protein
MSLESWSELCNFKISDCGIQAVGSSGGDGPVDSYLTLKGRSIPFLNLELLGVVFDRRLYTDTIEAKTFRTFIGVYSLFGSQRLSADVKLTMHEAFIRSVMT